VDTTRGDLPEEHPALHGGALILTTAAGARRLRGRLPPACTILDLGGRPELPPAGVLPAARDRGGGMVLTVRRHGSYLYLRYAMRGRDTPGR